MSTTARLALLPRDGLFCKDGRGWRTSASGRGHGLEWPWPSTVLGALRTAWGREEEARRGLSFGPVDWRERTAPIRLGKTLVARRPLGADWCAEHTVWPVPLDALWREGSPTAARLEPIAPTLPTLGPDDDAAREALWKPALDDSAKAMARPLWWSHRELSAWLAGEPVSVLPAHDKLAMARRQQVHVGIDPDTGAAREAVLFSHDVVETLERGAEWAIGLEVDLPTGDSPRLATLGSDARLARVEPLPEAMFEPPPRLLEVFRRNPAGLRLVAVTPLEFARGWLPDGLEREGNAYRGRVTGSLAEVILRAAFVPRPVHVSGWDMVAGKPKPTSRMVAPGAVYFFERADGHPFGEADARSLWLAALGARTDEGYGRVVPGVFSPRSDG